MKSGSLNEIETKEMYWEMENQSTLNIEYFRKFAKDHQDVELFGLARTTSTTLFSRFGRAAVDIESIAEELNVTKRTLQRRLLRNGWPFTKIRDICRLSVAFELLLNTSRSIDSISLHLGFKDRTSFTIAFKRWTGMPPYRFRKLNQLC